MTEQMHKGEQNACDCVAAAEGKNAQEEDEKAVQLFIPLFMVWEARGRQQWAVSQVV